MAFSYCFNTLQHCSILYPFWTKSLECVVAAETNQAAALWGALCKATTSKINIINLSYLASHKRKTVGIHFSESYFPHVIPFD